MTDDKQFFKSFSWEKPEKVEIIEGEGFDAVERKKSNKTFRIKHTSLSKNKQKFISVKYNTKKIVYKPHEGIFLNFAATQMNDEGMLKFAQDFGLLGIGGMNDAVKKEKTEYLRGWYLELANVKSVLKILYHYQNRNFKYMDRYFKFWKDTGLWEFCDDTYRFNNKKIVIGYMAEESLLSPWRKSKGHLFRFVNDHNVDRLIRDYLIYVLMDFYSPKVRIQFDLKSEWIRTAVKPRGLIGEIWRQIDEFIENKKLLKRCNFCKKLLVVGGNAARSDKKYCSQSCTVQGNRIENIILPLSKDLKKRDMKIIKNPESRYSSFDFLIYTTDDKLAAALEVSQTSTSPDSQKWEHKSENIRKKMLRKKISYAFLINKNGNLFFWDLHKKIMGKKTPVIPHISRFSRSKHDDLTKDLFLENETIPNVPEVEKN